MIFAFALQAISVILTFTAGSYSAMWWACIFAGAGHGVVEAVINPLCVSVFRHTMRLRASPFLRASHANQLAALSRSDPSEASTDRKSVV